MKTKSRLISVLLALVLIVALVPATVMSYDPIGDGVLEPPESYDIFINVDAGFGMTAEAFSALLRAKMLEIDGTSTGSGGTYNVVDTSDIKTAYSVTTIDTTNLDGWYVYDHYNVDATPSAGSRVGYWGDSANLGGKSRDQAWMDTYGMTSLTDTMRPAYFMNDSYANTQVSTGNTFTTIPDLLADNRLNTTTALSHRLKEHIYSYMDADGKPGMWFLGYGSWSIADFLFYPTTSTGSKNVKFTVESTYVVTHAMNGAGFLFNTAIDAAGIITGYYVYYVFSSPTAVSRMSIYKIKPGITATEFHNGTASVGTQPSNSTRNRISLLCDEIAFVTNPTWASVVNIDATITTESIQVLQAPNGQTLTPVEFTYTGTTTTTTTVEFPTVTTHGFGPLVQFDGSGHSCARGSGFKFSNLEMSFMDKNNTVLDSLANADYIKNAEKYFINLLSTDSGSTLSDSDWEAMARLREDNIYYGTNVRNPYLNDGGIVSSGAPQGNNGISVLGLDKNDPNYYEDLALALAKFILTGKKWNSALPSLETSTPVAMYYVMAINPNPLNPKEVQVYDIVRNFITSSAGVQIYTEDHSTGGYKNGSPIAVTSRAYTITYPNGSTSTVNVTGSALNSKKDNLLVLKSDCDLGQYSVTLVVTNANGDVSKPVTSYFTVGEDANPPVITWVTPVDNTLLFETVDTAVKVRLTDDFAGVDEYGIAAYCIGYKYPGDAAPIYGTQRTVGSYPNYRKSYDLTVDIPIGVYELFIQVWDGAGRLTVDSLSVDNRYDLSNGAVNVTGKVIDDIFYPTTTVTYAGKTLRIGNDYTLAYVNVLGQEWQAVATAINGSNYKNSASVNFVNPTSSGFFQIIVYPVGNDAPTGMYAEAYASILSPTHYALLKSGHNVLIEIYVERVDEEMVRLEFFKDWAAIWNTFGNNWRPGFWWDITAFITLTGYNKVPVHEFYDDIMLTMDMPQGVSGTSFLHYSHVLSDTKERIDGKLPDMDDAGRTGTYGLRYFSFYSLTIGQKGSGNNVVQTGDDTLMMLPIIGCMSGAAFVTVAVVNNKKRRRTAEDVQN